MSLSHRKNLDIGEIGIHWDNLPDFADGFLDLNSWFGELRNNLPLELEIGSGKGTFLVAQAAQNKDINYIGIEWASAYWRHGADRCRRHELDNVRMLRGEATAFVRQYVADNTLNKVHIYFPDPWPKKRHNKRRTFQEGFLRDLHRALKKDGLINVATDHLDYFNWMQEHAAKVDDIFERQPFVPPDSAQEGELVGTNFERKYRKEGREFNGFSLRAIK